MGTLLSMIVVASLFWLVWTSWRQFDETQPADLREPLWPWVGKGLAAPLGIWLFFNTSLFSRLPPLLPSRSWAQALSTGVNVPSELFRFAALSTAWMSTFWAATSLLWLVARIGTRTERRQDFLSLCAMWTLFTAPLIWLVLYLFGWGATGAAVTLWAAAVARATVDLAETVPLEPSYAAAVAKMKSGKTQEAEWEVIRELEQVGDDFQGWLLLAELYAEHFKDLATAEQTILDLCAHPKTNWSQISVALHRLADWQLKIADDPVAAHRTLELICLRMPGTHLDRMARLRINRLPPTREALLEERAGKPIPLKPSSSASSLSSFAEDQRSTSGPPLAEPDAPAGIERCLARLGLAPDDIETREELARLWADQAGQAQQGIQQLEELLQLPDPPSHKRIEWLTLVANWQLKYRQDRDAACHALRRLMRDYPQSVQAFAAQCRINLMEAEAKRPHPRPGN